MKPANSVLSGLGTTVFEVMSGLARQHEAVNLGQGFPDEGAPEDVIEAAAEALRTGNNQYPSMMGTPELRQAVAAHGTRFYGLEVDWQREVMVTSGATEALAACLFGLVEPGDEVVLFQPLYDAYAPLVRRAGGVPRYVTLTAPDWEITREALEAVFTPKTKAVLLNNPLNPAARVFGHGELELVAEFVRAYDCAAICDEVYEHLTFDGRRHISLITLDGMRDRCLKIGSAGKTFSLTGWKVGYVTAAPDLLAPVAKAHQFLTFTTPPNLQTAVAYGLVKDDRYFTGLAEAMQAKRDRLGQALRALGVSVLDSQGTYFLNIDVAALGWTGDDVSFSRHLVETAGLATIPVSAFYEETPVRHVVRLCFCKRDAVLDAGVERLARYLKAGG